jgi:hypothetical protein
MANLPEQVPDIGAVRLRLKGLPVELLCLAQVADLMADPSQSQGFFGTCHHPPHESVKQRSGGSFRRHRFGRAYK